jgi:polysaccharide export outer membrane protein
MRRISSLLLLVAAAISSLLLIESPASAQEKSGGGGQSKPAPVPATRAAAAGVLTSTDEDYRIGASDVIEIQVEDAPELSGTWRVNANGTFPMPYVGRVSAKDKTTDELQKEITEALRGRYLKAPQVAVLVKQINSRAFFIQGAIRSPGVFYIEGHPSLLELITVAGGLADNHGSVAFIIRRVKSPGASQTAEPKAVDVAMPDGVVAVPQQEGNDPSFDVRSVNISGLFKGRLDQNAFLEPGDIVNIPVADVFFVAGEVNAPGSFQLKEGTTLRQAISLAQGTTFEAAKSRGLIFRDDAAGKRSEIPIDIDAIMSGKKEDVQILANDIIIVPNSRFKSIAGAMLKALGLSSARLPIR